MKKVIIFIFFSSLFLSCSKENNEPLVSKNDLLQEAKAGIPYKITLKDVPNLKDRFNDEVFSMLTFDSVTNSYLVETSDSEEVRGDLKLSGFTKDYYELVIKTCTETNFNAAIIYYFKDFLLLRTDDDLERQAILELIDTLLKFVYTNNLDPNNQGQTKYYDCQNTCVNGALSKNQSRDLADIQRECKKACGGLNGDSPCRGTGYFRDPNNCAVYYYCTVTPYGSFRYTKFTCGGILLFDTVLKICNWPELVIC